VHYVRGFNDKFYFAVKAADGGGDIIKTLQITTKGSSFDWKVESVF